MNCPVLLNHERTVVKPFLWNCVLTNLLSIRETFQKCISKTHGFNPLSCKRSPIKCIKILGVKLSYVAILSFAFSLECFKLIVHR